MTASLSGVLFCCLLKLVGGQGVNGPGSPFGRDLTTNSTLRHISVANGPQLVEVTVSLRCCANMLVRLLHSLTLKTPSVTNCVVFRFACNIDGSGGEESMMPVLISLKYKTQFWYSPGSFEVHPTDSVRRCFVLTMPIFPAKFVATTQKFLTHDTAVGWLV